MIFASIGMPLFKAKKTAWIGLEGLCRQTGINFEWELVVAEESQESIGRTTLTEYFPRLRDIGCVNIVYLGLESWIPLADKISFIIRNCSKESKVYIPNAADFFSPPKRFATIEMAWEDCHFDWYSPMRLILYNVSDGRALVSDNKNRERKEDYSGRAISMDLLRKAAGEIKERVQNVDGMIWNSVHDVTGPRFVMYLDKSENWKYGLSVEGTGSLSGYVKECFDRPFEHQYPCTVDLNSTIPADIMDRLKKLAPAVKPMEIIISKKEKAGPQNQLATAKARGKIKSKKPSPWKKISELPRQIAARIRILPPDEMQAACKDLYGYCLKQKWIKD